MLVSELMSRDVTGIDSGASVQKAARLMAELDVGAVPVNEAGTMVGILTVGDVMVRVVARGLPPAETIVRDVMSRDVFTCLDEDKVEDAAATMRDHNISRLPVLTRDGRLVGLLEGSAIPGQARD